MVKNPKKWIDVPVGQLFKVVRNTNGHNYPLNTALRVELRPNSASGQVISTYNHLNIADVIFLNVSLDDLIEEEKALLNELKEVQKRITFMKEKNLTTLDIPVYEACLIIDTLKQKGEEEAVKQLAKLLK